MGRITPFPFLSSSPSFFFALFLSFYLSVRIVSLPVLFFGTAFDRHDPRCAAVRLKDAHVRRCKHAKTEHAAAGATITLATQLRLARIHASWVSLLLLFACMPRL